MSGKILLTLITVFVYAFLVYDGLTRLSYAKFYLGIYLLFYTFVFIFALSHLWANDKNK